jgi:Tfp pilus assembly protein PilN
MTLNVPPTEEDLKPIPFILDGQGDLILIALYQAELNRYFLTGGYMAEPNEGAKLRAAALQKSDDATTAIVRVLDAARNAQVAVADALEALNRAREATWDEIYKAQGRAALPNETPPTIVQSSGTPSAPTQS